MKYQLYIAILFSLVSLALNALPDLILYSHRTINKADDEIVELTFGTNGLIIYTKFEESSKIIIDLGPKEAINESLIYYDKVKENNNFYIPEKKFKPTIISIGNKYKCTYSVSEGDGYKYGALIIDQLSKSITVSVTVVSEQNFWIFIVIGIIVFILLIIGIFFFCKKCYRCVCCKS